MDATEILQRVHDEIRDLLEAAEDAARDPTLRGDLFARIREELRLHDTLEEEIFYPTIRHADPSDRRGGDLAESGIRAHAEMAEVVAELSGLDAGSREFARRLRRLRKKFEQHARAEEDRSFLFAWRKIGAQRLLAMGAQMETRRETLLLGRHAVALL
jgi:hypothetical protein